MKRVLLMALVALATTANAEEKNGMMASNEDNTAVLKANDSVTTNDGAAKTDKDKDDDDDGPWSLHAYIGIDIPLSTPSDVDFAPFRSWEIGATFLQYDYTPKQSKTTLSAGLGLIFRNYTLSGHDKMFSKVNDQIVVGPRESNMSDLSASIYTMGFSMPLLVKQRFGKNFGISLGAQLNWYCYARANNEYEIGDHEYDINIKDIGYKPVTVDILGIIHVADGFGIYCKYSPMNVMKSGRGPEYNSISVGFYFF